MVSLPHDICEADMESYFKQFGDIEDVRIIRDKEENVMRGFGFVLFKDRLSYNRVFEHGEIHQIKGKDVECRRVLLRDELQNMQPKVSPQPSDVDDNPQLPPMDSPMMKQMMMNFMQYMQSQGTDVQEFFNSSQNQYSFMPSGAEDEQLYGNNLGTDFNKIASPHSSSMSWSAFPSEQAYYPQVRSNTAMNYPPFVSDEISSVHSSSSNSKKFEKKQRSAKERREQQLIKNVLDVLDDESPKQPPKSLFGTGMLFPPPNTSNFSKSEKEKVDKSAFTFGKFNSENSKRNQPATPESPKLRSIFGYTEDGFFLPMDTTQLQKKQELIKGTTVTMATVATIADATSVAEPLQSYPQSDDFFGFKLVDSIPLNPQPSKLNSLKKGNKK